MTTNDHTADYLADGPPGSSNERLDRIRRVLDDGATWVVPPQSVSEDLLAGIQGERDRPSRRRGSWLRRYWPRVVVGLAAVLLVGLVAGTFVGTDPITNEIVLNGTDLEPLATGIAALTSTGSGWSIRLDLFDLPPAESGFYYEGWVWSDDGQGVSIGTFHLRGGPEPVQLWAGVDVEAYPWIWITLQEVGAGAAVSDRLVMQGMRESAD